MKASAETIIPTMSDFETIHELISGRAYAAAVYVAAKLGIADLLRDKDKTANELANELNVNEQALYRLMRALASMNIFNETGDKLFSLTPLAATLRSDIPNSIRDLTIMCGSDWHWQTWGGLLYTIQTGKAYFPNKFGKEFFPFIKENEEAEIEFNNGMSSLSSLNNYAIADQYAFPENKTIIDIGGGHGGLLRSILKVNPTAKGILFDLPSVTKAATRFWKDDSINHRLTILGGDFFAGIPAGGDIYILKHVLHGLDDQQSTKLLKNIAATMPAHAKLLIIEMIIPDDNARSFSKFNDLGMMLISGRGQERSQKQFEEIITDSSLAVKNIYPAHFGVCLIETIIK